MWYVYRLTQLGNVDISFILATCLAHFLAIVRHMFHYTTVHLLYSYCTHTNV
jgi:hypothetical protein